MYYAVNNTLFKRFQLNERFGNHQLNVSGAGGAVIKFNTNPQLP